MHLCFLLKNIYFFIATTLSRLTTTKKPWTTGKLATEKIPEKPVVKTTENPTTKMISTVSVDSISRFNQSKNSSTEVTFGSSNLDENSHVTSWCTTNFILEGVVLSGGIQAGLSEDVGKVETMSECMQRCCQSKLCTVAFLEKGACHLLKCYDKELCKAKIKSPEHVLGYTMRDGWSLFTSAEEAMHDARVMEKPINPMLSTLPFTTNANYSLQNISISTDQVKTVATMNPDYCHQLETLHNVRLRGGMRAGIFSEHGAVSSLETCVQYCCRDSTCNLAYMIGKTCYTVNCFNRELCKTFDVPKFFLNPVIAFVSRVPGEERKSNKIERSIWIFSRYLIDKFILKM